MGRVYWAGALHPERLDARVHLPFDGASLASRAPLKAFPAFESRTGGTGGKLAAAVTWDGIRMGDPLAKPGRRLRGSIPDSGSTSVTCRLTYLAGIVLSCRTVLDHNVQGQPLARRSLRFRIKAHPADIELIGKRLP